MPSIGGLGGFVLISLPIPWCHFARTHHVTGRLDTYGLVQPVADAFPPGPRALVAQWDSWEAWLIHRSIGIRHQEHKMFYQYLVQTLPPRSEGARIGWEERPVTSAGPVGVLGWGLPNVAIIDSWGLNDRIVARFPARPSAHRLRQMAHERQAPDGYVECFRTNLLLEPPHVRVVPRPAPLRDDDIRACEKRHWN